MSRTLQQAASHASFRISIEVGPGERAAYSAEEQRSSF